MSANEALNPVAEHYCVHVRSFYATAIIIKSYFLHVQWFDCVSCIYTVLRFMHLRDFVFLEFMRDFRRVLFAPPLALGEALGEAL